MSGDSHDPLGSNQVRTDTDTNGPTRNVASPRAAEPLSSGDACLSGDHVTIHEEMQERPGYRERDEIGDLSFCFMSLDSGT